MWSQIRTIRAIFLRRKGRAENMVFLAGHFLMGQLRFEQAAGSGARQILSDQRVDPKHGKRLLGQQDAAAGALLHPGQDLQIAAQRAFIHHIYRGAQPRLGAILAVHHSTVEGCSSTTQGRPYWFSISMKGSGSISSRL